MSIVSRAAKSMYEGNLIIQILIGICFGVVVGFFLPDIAYSVSMLGDIFIGALKAIAPILVFVLIIHAVANSNLQSSGKGMKRIILLYAAGTLLASSTAAIFCYFFPVELILTNIEQAALTAPKNVIDVIKDIVFKTVDNPVNALATANYIGILTWAIGIGIALRHASNQTKTVLEDINTSVSKIIKFVIRLAPFGIFGLVSFSVAQTGFGVLKSYLDLIILLLAAMAFVAFVLNPIIVFLQTKKNPFPLLFICLRESAITAFFTRSSAANIPVNLNLARKLKLNEELYSVSIPLGATINMAGAAIVIGILTLSTVYTLGIQITLGETILLCIVAAISACGCSGVAGGSLLLIPLACSLFGISNDIAMQVVAIGFIIGVIQDSAETALNSSTDVFFTAACSDTIDLENAK